MKKFQIMVVLFCSGGMVSFSTAHAQVGIVEAVKEASIKVIKAVDLKIQRLQNKTIWLQNAQKTLENAMAKVKLEEISNWVGKHREQYAAYFEELQKVKAVISGYYKVKEIFNKQLQIINEYKKAYALFKQDAHFSADEILYMGQVYTSLLEESFRQLDQLDLILHAFTTQMSDGKRMDIIQSVSGGLDNNLRDLRQFNSENILLSLQRSKQKNDLETVKQLYGLQ